MSATDSSDVSVAHPNLKPWGKGTSGNPNGKPKGEAWFRRLCRKRTMKALHALEKALEREEHAVAAAKVLLDHAWGKAPAVVTLPDDSSDTAPSAADAQAAAERLRLRAGSH